MSDAEILEVFGIDISKAESTRTRGKDGYSMSYKLGDQEVSITRSVVTGIAIFASGPIKGTWSLGGGNS